MPVLCFEVIASDEEAYGMTRLQETNRYEAVGQSGQRYTIIESTQQTSLDATKDGRTLWADDSRFLRAVNFGPVGQISDSEFVVFLSGERLKRV
jgi:hypothetical protein